MPGDIIQLNVGGKRFATSKETLIWIPDSFFTSLLSGRISSLKDEKGAIFIDRDPALFSVILNYLRTKEVDLSNVDIGCLKHEAEFYGIKPLVRRLSLCEELDAASCGDVLFHGYLGPPCPPVHEFMRSRSQSIVSTDGSSNTSRGTTPQRHSSADTRPGTSQHDDVRSHVRQTSVDLSVLSNHGGLCGINRTPSTHSMSRLSMSSDTRGISRPVPYESLSSRLASAQPVVGYRADPLKVTMLRGHHNWIAVAYPHFVCCFRMKDSTGWHLIWTSSYLDIPVERIAINAKVMSANQDNTNKMVAASAGSLVRLWSISDGDGDSREIGVFNLNVSVDSLFFIGSQLVALSKLGKVGVWHSMTHNWQIQDVNAITSYDKAGSFLLLGCENGSVYYIDMQKFPLRMKDNDLLVTELYRDPAGDKVTALSVYLTPKTTLDRCSSLAGLSGNWIEIAYGTSSGTVRVIVQHPETVGHGPQLFQTFTVHRSPVTKVMLSEKHLVSVCSEYNHVRTWSVTRFRGMISTQPGSTPLASFKVVSLEDYDPHQSYMAGNDFGPFGEQDDQQVFVQKVVPETDQLFIRLSSSGRRVCVIKSVDGTTISAFRVHECEGSSRMGSRPRRFLFTGHTNGGIQMWDLTTALDLMSPQDDGSTDPSLGGPTPKELVKLLDQCEICQSQNSTPCISPSPSIMGASMSSRTAHDVIHGASLACRSSHDVIPGMAVRNLESLENTEEDRGMLHTVDKSQVTSL